MAILVYLLVNFPDLFLENGAGLSRNERISAHSMGHSSSRAPIGRFQRINSAYCPSRARTVGA